MTRLKKKRNRWSASKKLNSVATSVENVTPHPVIYPGTNKPIEVWILIRQKNATRAVKLTYQCQLWQCIYSLTNWLTVVIFAANNSRDRGFFRDIYDLTLVKNRTDALTVEKHSLTGQFTTPNQASLECAYNVSGPIYELTCKPTLTRNVSSVRTVLKVSH